MVFDFLARQAYCSNFCFATNFFWTNVQSRNRHVRNHISLCRVRLPGRFEFNIHVENESNLSLYNFGVETKRFPHPNVKRGLIANLSELPVRITLCFSSESGTIRGLKLCQPTFIKIIFTLCALGSWLSGGG
jgi:hypothetical protein